MTSSCRVVFAGTPAFAATHLDALLKVNIELVGVYTQPDRPGKRGKKLVPSPVKQLAQDNALPVYQPLNFKDPADIKVLADLKPDILVVVAYGLILPQAVLDIPTIAPINVHASLLPRWRGAAPVERAIAAGDNETGVDIMIMEAGLDTGPVLAETKVSIGRDTSGDELREMLAKAGCDALINTIQALQDGTYNAIPQSEDGVCYAHKLQREETVLDWSLPATALHNKIRAFNSSNTATCTLGDTRIKIWKSELNHTESDHAPGTITGHDDHKIWVQCGEGRLALTSLQLPGKKALASRDVLNGNAALFAIGNTLH